MGVFSIVAVFMTQTLGTGLRGVLGGKRRETAIQEGQRLLEVARSLSYANIGLAATDATINTDSAIETQTFGTPPVAKKAFRSGTTWEPLEFVANTTGHPFNPHIADFTRGSTSLTRYVYVTGIDDNSDGNTDLKRVTARVSWNDSGSAGPENEIRVQTIISEASGKITCESNCTETGTRLTGGGFASGGTLTVGASTLLGLSAPLNIALPTTTGKSDYRAVSRADCTAKSLSMNVLDVLDLPAESVAVSADDDSRTTMSANPAPESKPGSLAIPGVGNLLATTVNSPVSCEANVNTLGHELGTGSALSTALNTQTNVAPVSLPILNWLFTLASVQGLPVSQQIDHEVVAGQREVFSQSSAALGTVQALKLPFGGLDDGLVQVDGISYGASVRGSEGTPSAAPTITAPTFTLRVFDNASKLGAACTTGLTLTPGITVSRSGSYCVFTVNPATAGFTGLHIPVTHNFTSVLGVVNIVSLAYTIEVDILPPAKDPIAGATGANGETTWTAEYTPLSVTASLDVGVAIPLLPDINLIDADVNLNLGTVQAKACAGGTCS